MVDKYRMTDTKLLWHPQRLADWYNGNRIAPLHIELGITSACNLNCSFCYGKEIGQTDWENKSEISAKSFERLVKECEELGIKSITLIGEGENTIHSEFDKILDIIINSEIDFGIATNGIKIDYIDKFLKAFVWIRISLCGSNRDTYNKLHGRDSFDRVIGNIEKLVNRKKCSNYDTTIGLQAVITNNNQDDMVNMTSLGRKLGVDYYVLKPCADTPSKKFKINYEEIKYRFQMFRDYLEMGSTDDYSIIIKTDKFEGGAHHPYKTCYGTEFAIAIDSKGNVAPCGHLLSREDFIIGNINQSTLYDIIDSDTYWNIQDKVKQLDLDKECETNCMHYHMNQLLEKIKDKKPPHINFI